MADITYILYQILFYAGIGIATLLFLFYLYLRNLVGYWKSIGVNEHYGISDLFYIMTQGSKKHLKEFDMEIGSRFGKIYGGFLFTQHILMVRDPEIIKNIFIKDFNHFPGLRQFLVGDEVLDNLMPNTIGEHWKRLRSIVTPTFTSGMLRKMSATVENSAKQFTKILLEICEKDNKIDIKGYAGAFSMDVMATSAFGTKINTFEDPDNVFATNAKGFFSQGFSLKLLIIFVFPKIAKFFNIQFSSEGTKFFIDVSKQILQERQKREIIPKPCDLLQILIDHQNSVKGGKETDGEKPVKGMSEAEVYGQCILFLVAGYDTVSTAISTALYSLALNPEIQEKLVQEINDVIENNEKVDIDTIQQMQYLDCVISENLRLNPATARIERKCYQDYKIEGYGITVPKGLHINVPLNILHRDPEIYPNPDDFDPDRFLPENKAKRSPYSYAPFGMGPRVCVAQRMALMEIKIALFHLLPKLRFYRVPETPIPLKYYNGSGVTIPTDVTLGIEKREN